MQNRNKEDNNTNENFVYDDLDISEDTSTNSKFEKKIKKIKEELKKCQKEKQEYLDGWQRSKADFINFKNRSEESKKELVQYASENILLEIIPILDNFEQAFKNKQVWESVDGNWRKGIELIYSQLKDVLKRNDVTVMEPVGEEFDPNIHDSIEIMNVEDKEDDDKILEVTQKGYKIVDKIIRHPIVKVGKFE